MKTKKKKLGQVRQSVDGVKEIKLDNENDNILLVDSLLLDFNIKLYKIIKEEDLDILKKSEIGLIIEQYKNIKIHIIRNMTIDKLNLFIKNNEITNLSLIMKIKDLHKILPKLRLKIGYIFYIKGFSYVLKTPPYFDEP